MTILFAASEMHPLARTGGLGDVIEALPGALRDRGHEVSVVLPCYAGLPERSDLQVRSTGVTIPVPVGQKTVDAEILEATAPNGVQVFLVRADAYFDRPGLYGADNQPYDDNAERFIFFSRAIVELARRIMPPPEILHLHDWQTALAAVYVKQRRLPFQTVLTLHNVAHQGEFWAYDFPLTTLPGEYFAASGVEFYGKLNLLKGGILSADAVTTVSERYSREIQTPEYGARLDAVLRENSRKLTGILNGIDAAHWNPQNDSLLPATFSADDIGGKKACREALLSSLHLAPSPTGPVFSIVARLATQKGIELLFPVIDRLLADDVRLIVLGEGEPAFERELTIASKRHASRFRYVNAFEDKLAHLIHAGSDIALAPSFTEPCGLNVMYGLRYGTPPIARATGGLHEIVHDYDPSASSGNGFLFFEPTSEAFWDAIVRARQLFRDQEAWTQLMRRALEQDFSWGKAVERYEHLYRRLTKRR